MTTQQIADRITMRRLDCGLTQKELGEQIGVTEGCIQNWEQCRRAVSVEKLVKLAGALDTRFVIKGSP